MKLAKFLPEVVAHFETVKNILPQYAEELRRSGDYRDFDTRLAYDVFYTTYKNEARFDLYDRIRDEFPDFKDSHLATLLKKALHEVMD